MALKIGNGLNLLNQRIQNVGSPSAASDAANKSYVDALLNGLQWKPGVRVATTASGTLASAFANGSVVDGVTLATGDRILIKNQSTASENGIYVVAASGAPTRSADADGAGEIVPNTTVLVAEGTVNADTAWTVTNNGTITVGTTGLTFAPVGGGATYTAGNGLQLSSNAFSVLLDSASGLVVSGTGLKVDPSVVARKYAANIGNGSLTSIPVTHNLGTRDVVVSVHDTTTYEEVLADVVKTDANNVTITFATAPASNAYRVTVIG
ncbi:hypothetical protein [Skermania piniformis]|uniref:Head decoration protein n=1 Tax=Skermania pinensis TaxID=39122 RepID=A0ABX8SDX8_9ACTN|nr:hypothetical protein [Skermania piniformis]QXQ14825.1 hypothetical protein KV203_05440 [Skermania piniformis]